MYRHQKTLCCLVVIYPTNVPTNALPKFSFYWSSHDESSTATHAKIITIAHQNMDGWAYDHAYRSTYKYVGSPSGWLNCVHFIFTRPYVFHLQDTVHGTPVLLCPSHPSIRPSLVDFHPYYNCYCLISVCLNRLKPRGCFVTITQHYSDALVALDGFSLCYRKRSLLEISYSFPFPLAVPLNQQYKLDTWFPSILPILT